jgi:hypothetical protein
MRARAAEAHGVAAHHVRHAGERRPVPHHARREVLLQRQRGARGRCSRRAPGAAPPSSATTVARGHLVERGGMLAAAAGRASREVEHRERPVGLRAAAQVAVAELHRARAVSSSTPPVVRREPPRCAHHHRPHLRGGQLLEVDANRAALHPRVALGEAPGLLGRGHAHPRDRARRSSARSSSDDVVGVSRPRSHGAMGSSATTAPGLAQLAADAPRGLRAPRIRAASSTCRRWTTGISASAAYARTKVLRPTPGVPTTSAPLPSRHNPLRRGPARRGGARARAAEVRAATVARAGGATAGCTSSAARAAGSTLRALSSATAALCGSVRAAARRCASETSAAPWACAMRRARVSRRVREPSGSGCVRCPLAHVEGAEPPGAEPTADVTRGVEGGAEDVQGGRGGSFARRRPRALAR